PFGNRDWPKSCPTLETRTCFPVRALFRLQSVERSDDPGLETAIKRVGRESRVVQRRVIQIDQFELEVHILPALDCADVFDNRSLGPGGVSGNWGSDEEGEECEH